MNEFTLNTEITLLCFDANKSICCSPDISSIALTVRSWSMVKPAAGSLRWGIYRLKTSVLVSAILTLYYLVSDQYQNFQSCTPLLLSHKPVFPLVLQTPCRSLNRALLWHEWAGLFYSFLSPNSNTKTQQTCHALLQPHMNRLNAVITKD